MCVLSVCVRERVCCDGGEGSFGCVCARGCVWGGMRNVKSLGDLTENFIKKLKSIHTHILRIFNTLTCIHTRISLNTSPKDL